MAVRRYFWRGCLGDKEEGGRKIFAEFLLNRRNCLFEMGPESVDGWGNYVITVGGTPEKPALVMADENAAHGAAANHGGEKSVVQVGGADALLVEALAGFIVPDLGIFRDRDMEEGQFTVAGSE